MPYNCNSWPGSSNQQSDKPELIEVVPAFLLREFINSSKILIGCIINETYVDGLSFGKHADCISMRSHDLDYLLFFQMS